MQNKSDEIQKLNEFIHTEVMGECWHKVEVTDEWREYLGCKLCGASFGRHVELNPDYAASISDAMRAVAEMEKQNIYFTIQTHNNCVSTYSLDEFNGRRCVMNFIGDAVFAKSLPLAICRAIRSALTNNGEQS